MWKILTHMGIVWICIPVRILELDFYEAWHFPQRNYELGRERGKWSVTKKMIERRIKKEGKEWAGAGRTGLGERSGEEPGAGGGAQWGWSLCHTLLWDVDQCPTIPDIQCAHLWSGDTSVHLPMLWGSRPLQGHTVWPRKKRCKDVGKMSPVPQHIL